MTDPMPPGWKFAGPSDHLRPNDRHTLVPSVPTLDDMIAAKHAAQERERPADHRTAETMRARALEAERLLSEATARAERAERLAMERWDRAEVEAWRQWGASITQPASSGAWNDDEARDEIVGLIARAERDAATAEGERDEVRDEARRLRTRVEYLERAESLSGEGHLLARVSQILGNPPSLRIPERVDTLTRERDDARHMLDLVRREVRAAVGEQWQQGDGSLPGLIARLTRERDGARRDHGNVLDAYTDLDQGVQSALGEHATGDTVADVRRVVERAEIAAVNEAGSADVNAVLLERIGATHLDEACEVLWRDREERDRLRAYLARALRGCDARERVAIEADMAREASDGGE